MPRIAPALAVLLTFVTCIGFNIARYPVVWEMAAPEGLSQAVQPEPSIASPQSAVTASSSAIPNLTLALKSATAVGSEAPEQSVADLPPSRRSAETMHWPSAPQAPVAVGPPCMEESFSRKCRGGEPPGAPERWLVGAADDERMRPDRPEAPVPERPLVAVAPPQRAVDAGGRSRLQSRRDPPAIACAYGSSVTVRGLPPLDQVWNVPKANHRPPLSDDAILIYPMAGMR